MKKSPSYFPFLLVFLFVSRAHAVATPWESNPHGQVRLISPYRVAPRQGPIYFGLEFKTERDWHVYWRNPGDSGYAPRLKWAGSQGFRDALLLWPAPHYYSLPGNLIAIGYSGDVVYPIRAQATGSGDKLHAVVDLDYLTCGDSCVPYHYTFTLDVPTGTDVRTDPDFDRLLDKYKAMVPVPLASRPDILLKSALYRRGDDFYFQVQLPASLHASARHVELFLDKNPVLDFRRSQAVEQQDGSVKLNIPGQLKGSQTPPTHTALSFTINGLGSDKAPLAVERSAIYRVLPAPPGEASPIGQTVSSSPVSRVVSLPWALLLGFLGGLILNIMPCVLPILSIKLFGLMEHSGQERGVIVRDAVASAAGIVVSFLMGGVIAILAKAAGTAVGWGVQFQDPRFVAFLAVIVTLFALNLWGVFEITLPPVLAQVGAISGGDDGVASYFVSGMFATLLATPCSAPFLGTAMGFALAQPPSTTLAIFTAAGVGMALPYLLLAMLPQTLHWLPKPGAWMVRVRWVMGLFLAATVVWLSFVLKAQVDHTGLNLYYLGLIVVCLLAFLKRILSQLRQSQWSVWVGILMLLVGMMKGVNAHRQTQVQPTVASAGLGWRPFDPDVIPGEVALGHSIFVDVTADWCFTCKYNEKVVLNSSAVVRIFQQQNIVLMKADWTNRDAAIGDYLKSFNRYGIPFYALYRPGKPPVILSEFLTQAKVLRALKE